MRLAGLTLGCPRFAESAWESCSDPRDATPLFFTCNLPGWKQSVARGEVLALVITAAVTSGDLIFVTDNKAVLLGWRGELWKHPSGNSADFWKALSAILENRAGTVEVVFTFSHLSEDGSVFRRLPALPS